MDINKVIAGPEYSFINENEYLKDRIMFLTFGGSYAYGTNIEGSDIDIRGVCMHRPDELIGIKEWEQYDDPNTDTVIYGFNKIVKLLMNVNPNVIEMLGCNADHYTMVSEAGQLLLDNSHIFLSQKAFQSFGGYANSQLRRLQNAVARDRMTQSEKEKFIKNSIHTAMFSFKDRYLHFDDNSIKLHIENSVKECFDEEILMNISLKDYPLRDFASIYSEMLNIVRDYDKLNSRNKKKDDMHLNKHAMHLVRLYLMCLDIVERGEIKTYRLKDLEVLMAIRSGYYMNEDGTYKREFFDYIDSLEKQLIVAMSTTKLPVLPDYEAINKFVIKINRMALEAA